MFHRCREFEIPEICIPSKIHTNENVSFYSRFILTVSHSWNRWKSISRFIILTNIPIFFSSVHLYRRKICKFKYKRILWKLCWRFCQSSFGGWRKKERKKHVHGFSLSSKISHHRGFDVADSLRVLLKKKKKFCSRAWNVRFLRGCVIICAFTSRREFQSDPVCTQLTRTKRALKSRDFRIYYDPSVW